MEKVGARDRASRREACARLVWASYILCFRMECEHPWHESKGVSQRSTQTHKQAKGGSGVDVTGPNAVGSSAAQRVVAVFCIGTKGYAIIVCTGDSQA